jgi:Tol biopolymer transport system component
MKNQPAYLLSDVFWIVVFLLLTFPSFARSDQSTFPPRGAFHAVWSPDGKHLAYELDNRVLLPPRPDTVSLYIADYSGDNQKRISENFGRAFQWSSDGLNIAYRISLLSGYRIVNIGSDEEYTLPEITAMVWEKNGQDFVYAERHNICKTRIGRPSNNCLNVKDDTVSSFDISPDGRYVAFLTSDLTASYIVLLDFGTKRSKTLNLGKRTQVFAYQKEEWSKFESLLLFIDATNRLYTLDPAFGEPKLVASDVMEAHWSPAAEELVYLKKNEGLFLVSADGTANRLIRPIVEGEYGWSPDGSMLVVGSYATTRQLPDKKWRFPGPIQPGVIVFDVKSGGGK